MPSSCRHQWCQNGCIQGELSEAPKALVLQWAFSSLCQSHLPHRPASPLNSTLPHPTSGCLAAPCQVHTADAKIAQWHISAPAI